VTETLLYAENTGKIGDPEFNLPATPIKGVLPPNYHYVSLRNWEKNQAYGVPYELVGAVNPQLEPGFTFPGGENSKYALKFSVWPFKSVYFPERFYPPNEDEWNEHIVGCNQSFILKLNTRYRIHCWVKAPDNVSDFRYPQGYASPKGFRGYSIINPVDSGTDWTEFTSNIQIDNPADPTVKTWAYKFEFDLPAREPFTSTTSRFRKS